MSVHAHAWFLLEAVVEVVAVVGRSGVVAHTPYISQPFRDCTVELMMSQRNLDFLI